MPSAQNVHASNSNAHSRLVVAQKQGRNQSERTPNMFFVSCRLCLFLALVALSLSPDAAASPKLKFPTKQIGYGGGGRFTSAAIAPSNEKIVYVGSDVAGFFRSDDGGESFSVAGKELRGLSVADIVVAPDNPSKVVLITSDGLYWSEDAGATCALISPTIRYPSRFFGSILLLFGPQGELYAASDIDGVFIVRSLGESNTVEQLHGLEGDKVNSIALYQGKLYAATEETVSLWTKDGWEERAKGVPEDSHDIVNLLVHPHLGLLCVERKNGVFRFDPAKESWSSLGPKPFQLPASRDTAFKTLAYNPAAPENLFLASFPPTWPYMLLKTQNGGKDWSLVNRFALTNPTQNLNKSLEAIEDVTFSASGKLGLLADWWNLWRSNDGGTSWIQSYKGLQNTVVNRIDLPPGQPEAIFLSVADNGLMVSLDKGRTWTRRMARVLAGHARATAFSRTAPNKCYLLMNPWKVGGDEDVTFFHFYKSPDQGITWTHYRIRERVRKFSKNYVDGLPSNIIVDPKQDDIVYLSVNGYGIYRVDTSQPPDVNGEVKATNIGANLPTPYVHGPGALLANPHNPAILYAGALEGGVYKSKDGGASWRLLPGTQGFIFGMDMDPQNPDRLAACAGNKVLRSDNGGESWRIATIPELEGDNAVAFSVVFGPPNSRILYVGSTGINQAGKGLFVSRDDGQSFESVALDLPFVGVNALAQPKDPDALYVGFNGIGLYQAAPVWPR